MQPRHSALPAPSHLKTNTAGSTSNQYRSPHIAQFAAGGVPAAPRNFNAPRPGTAGQRQPPNPSVQARKHNRSASQPGNNRSPSPSKQQGVVGQPSNRSPVI